MSTLRAVVSTGSSAGATAIEAQLASLGLPGLRIEVRQGAAALDDAWAGVDYLLVVTCEPELVSAPLVERALGILRADPTTAAVGPSAADAPIGALTLAVSGGLLLARAEAVRAVGGFDRGLSPFADLDLCWRLWAAGHRVRSATDESWPLIGEDAPEADRAAALTLTLATMVDDEDRPDAAWAQPSARQLAAEAAGRRAEQVARRRRGLGELGPRLAAFTDAWAAARPAGGEARALVSTHVAPERLGARRRVAVLTRDVLAPSMAGPAIRAVAIATALAAEHEVVLGSLVRCDLELPGLEARYVREREVQALVDWCDIVIYQGWAMAGRSWFHDSDTIAVVDLYDPMHLEQLEHGREAEGDHGRIDAVRGAAATLNEQMVRADFVVCASDKQRDLWLGALATLGRVNPVTYDDDPSLRSFVGLVPFGVEDAPPVARAGAIKGVVEGIGPEDLVLLWGGGVYNWFDPLTLVRAVDRLRSRVPNVRLYFLGMTHPSPEVPTMRMATELRALAEELGLVGTHVFFNDGWVPHAERAAYLLDADIGVSTHLDHVETAYSFRTRILDYLWAGLPVVATGGDSFAALLEANGAGRTCAAGDLDGLEEALAALLLDPAERTRARAGSAALAEQMRWSQNLAPLVEFCRAPRRAPDIACPSITTSPIGAEHRSGLGRDLAVAVRYLRSGGVRLVAQRGAAAARRRWARARQG